MRNPWRILPAAAFVLAAGCVPRSAGSFVPDDYRAWSPTTRMELDYPVPGHGTGYRIVTVNETGKNAIRSTGNGGHSLEFPEGSVLVKEVYGSPGKPEPGTVPEMLAVMIKAPERDESRAGWLWVVKDMKTGKERLVTSRFCAECHSSANDRHPYGDRNEAREFRDYVFFPPPER